MNDTMKSENICMAIVIVAAVYYLVLYLPERNASMSMYNGTPCSARKGDVNEMIGPQLPTEEEEKQISAKRVVTHDDYTDEDLLYVASDDFYKQSNWPTLPNKKPKNVGALLDQRYTTTPRNTTGTQILLPGRDASSVETKVPVVSSNTQWSNLSEAAADQLMAQETEQ